MPRVISYTPAWLSRSGPGFGLFSEDDGASPQGNGSKNGSAETSQRIGQRRTVAHRGSEIFVATGNLIRWADLATMKSEWEEKEFTRSYVNKRDNSMDEEDEGDDLLEGVPLRILKLQYVHEPIQQLVCSPNNDLLAVVTEHTIHVCVLPDSSHLVQPDSGPIRPKSQIIGQTTHVLSQARITNALWHPLGVNGSCLVTVTEDVVVRLWELNLDNRWSAEEPSLAVDLRKLQFANTSEDDVQPDRIGKNRGFSTDVIGMEVASACFGSKGAEEEGAWSAMTLWVAMAEGDVYALCPLLPSKWQPPSTLIPSLTTSVAAKRDFVQVSKVSAGAKEICEQQYAWLKELDNDDPVMISGRSEFSDPIPVYRRPKTFNSIPLLQGPFSIIPGDVEDDLDLSDIAVVAPRLDAEGIYPDDDDESELLPGLTSAIVCLLTGSGRVYVCLDLDGVEGRWLPRKRSKSRLSQLDESIPELLVLEALETVDTSSLKQPLKVLPMFSADIHSRYAFFVTHDKGVSYLSTESLIEQLQGETEAEETSGLQLRIDSIMKGSHILREQILKFGKEGSKRDLSAPVIMQDSDLGYFLLTYCDGLPHAAVLDTPRDFEKGSGQDLGDSRRQREETPAHLLLTNPRPSFEPSKYLYQPSGIRAFIDTQVSSRYKHNLKDEIRLSAAALEIITDAHRLLSKETHAMKTGVSDLFTRCDEMLHELRNQIASVREIAEKVDHINGEDADTFDDDKARGSENLDERLQRAKDKYGELATRHDALKKRLALVGGRPLSEKEQGWVKEVDKLSKSLVSPEEIDEESEVLNGSKREYWQRFEEVQELAQELLEQARDATEVKVDEEKTRRSTSFAVPPDLRKTRVAGVMGLLDRESALVDATQERLERLSLAS